MTELADKSLRGYPGRLSVAAGEDIAFKVNSERAGSYRAVVGRFAGGTTEPGAGFRELRSASVNCEYPARSQQTDPGSYVLIEDQGRLALPDAFTMHAFVYATTPAKLLQVVLGRYMTEPESGYALALRRGSLTLLIGTGDRCIALESPVALQGSCWYSVAATYDPASSRVRLYSRSVVNSVNSLLSPITPVSGEGVTEHSFAEGPAAPPVPLLIGGCWASASRARVSRHFNGKIDSPKIWARPLKVAEIDALADGGSPDPQALLASWDFAHGIGPSGIPSDLVADAGPNGFQGRCVNFPARAMTGWNWTGSEERFVHAPAEYGAIHFHEDDLEDCGWDTDFTWRVPHDCRSGVYAVRLTHAEAEDIVPFFVLPPRGTAKARTLLLLPTASYLAYANAHFNEDALAESVCGRTAVINDLDFWHQQHVEFGASTYDTHTDGSGVHYSSALRPIITLRPGFRMAGLPWQLPADLQLIAWLEAQGFDYDVATDRELHDEGAELLRRYNVVMTGTHPEYYSQQMLDAWEVYLGAGGRAMYLGGNGFYWVIAWHPHKEHLIELRRGEYGTRAWQASPGEYYLQSTGERSGLWRGRGRAPQKTFGSGFTAQGLDRCSYYVQMPDATDPRVAFIMDGIAPDAHIGDFGLVGGGAAGLEIDRYDLTLGTPPEALLLAYSEGHSDNYSHAVEELFDNPPFMSGTMDPDVRADLVYFTTRLGGGVFSASSIAWCGSLLANGTHNNVSQITANVLRRFSSDEPLPPLESPAGH